LRKVREIAVHSSGETLQDFQPAIDQHSPWLHPAWVKAVFSPGVAASAAQLEAEWRRRDEQRRKLYPPRR